MDGRFDEVQGLAEVRGLAEVAREGLLAVAVAKRVDLFAVAAGAADAALKGLRDAVYVA